jgi:hypothetical protein
MPYTFTELTAPPRRLTQHLESFWLYFDFTVAAANGALVVTDGYFAAHISQLRPPDEILDPDWKSLKFKVDGGAGMGNVTMHHAQCRERRKTELINEYGRLLLFQFDPKQPRKDWLECKDWAASYKHPLYDNDAPDLRPYLFHKLSLGTAIQDRWAHCLKTREVDGKTKAVTAIVPFTAQPICGVLLQNPVVVVKDTPTGKEEMRFMPCLELKTFYGQDQRVSKEWTHFDAPPPAVLPAAVEGYVMVTQGAFKAILLGSQLDDWHMTAKKGWNAERICDQLAAILPQYPPFERNLETVGESAADAVVRPPADNLPVEVLFLNNLGSKTAVF